MPISSDIILCADYVLVISTILSINNYNYKIMLRSVPNFLFAGSFTLGCTNSLIVRNEGLSVDIHTGKVVDCVQSVITLIFRLQWRKV